MKFAYSSLAAPGWDLETLVDRAVEYGYDGLELRGLRGELHLPLCPELTRDPKGVRKLFADRKVALVCLGASATLTPKKPRDLGRQKAIVTDFIELSGAVGCPNVRLFVGDVERIDTRQAALSRAASALSTLAPLAARHGVTLLVENGGDFSGSADLWFLADAVSHPSVRVCWNQCPAMTVRERPTNSLPRLGSKIGMVHVCDARFDASGILLEHVPPGEGDVEVGRQIDLLKGLLYRGFVTFEWPRMWWPKLAPAESILPQAVQFLRARFAHVEEVLPAYKNDKNAPKLAPVPG